ncbi:MAG: response regulator [Deltaproteobacteria bacterium]|nr:response regulator [Deltaproteobacteria bacterium]
MSAKILIVEDHQDSREILRIQVGALGYEVVEAVNGEEAIEKARVKGPHLIIMDLGLPVMNGIEATIKLKQDPRTASIPVVAYTAWSKDQFEVRAREAGVIEFLTKPTPSTVLREVLQRVLEANMGKMASTV